MVRAVALLLCLPLTAAGAEIITPREPVPDRFIIVLKPAVTEVLRMGLIERIAEELAWLAGGKVLHSYSTVLGGFAIEAQRSALTPLLQDSRVAFVEQDSVMRATEVQRAPQSWGLDRIDQRELPLDNRFEHPGGGAGLRVYIVDTGVHATHRDFAGRIEAGFNSARDRVAEDTADCQGHGTHVAGTVAGTSWGVAKKARIVPVRVLGCDGSGTNADVIAGLDWIARQGISPAVVNMSLGGGASRSLDFAVRDLVTRGITVVAAAGNENADACNVSPARVAEAITVAASDRKDARASFSNKGRCVDLFAPGHGIGSASHQSDKGSRKLSGTSMAAPHVAGAAAIYIAARPKAKPAEVADALFKAAVPGKIADPAGSPNRLLQITGLAGATPPDAQPPNPKPGPTPDRDEKKSEGILCVLGLC